MLGKVERYIPWTRYPKHLYVPSHVSRYTVKYIGVIGRSRTSDRSRHYQSSALPSSRVSGMSVGWFGQGSAQRQTKTFTEFKRIRQAWSGADKHANHRDEMPVPPFRRYCRQGGKRLHRASTADTSNATQGFATLAGLQLILRIPHLEDGAVDRFFVCSSRFEISQISYGMLRSIFYGSSS